MTESVWDWAARREAELRSEFARVEFVIEVNPDADDIYEATELFGELVFREGHDLENVVKRFPSLTLLMLAGHAITGYGSYWDSFWEALGVDRNSELERTLRHCVPTLLGRCGLAGLPEVFERARYVEALAAHAGIPCDALEGLLVSLEGYAKTGQELVAASFLEWLTDPAVAYRMARIDLPVQSFIAHGGLLAVNLIDRIIDVAKFTFEQPEIWRELDLDTATTGIPNLLLGKLLDRFIERPFMGDHQVPSGGVSKQTPTLRYSVEDNQVVVDLPRPHTGAETPWQVSFAKVTIDVVAHRGWGVEEGSHPPTSAAITEVAPEVTISHEPTLTKRRFELFSQEDPLVLFAVDGRQLKVRDELPRSEVLALLPNDATIHDSETDRQIASMVPPFSPVGWRGWRMHTLNLTDHDGMYVSRLGSKQRVVKSTDLGVAEVFNDGLIAGMRTLSGRPVFNTRPAVDFPASKGPAMEWQVRTRRVGSQDWFTDCWWESGAEVSSVDPFDGVDLPILGEFEIQVRRGSSKVEQIMCIAEGVNTEFGELRMPEGAGLSQDAVVVFAETEIHISPGFAVLGPGQRDIRVALCDEQQSLQVVVRPPSVELRIDPVGHMAEWRVAPKAMSSKDFGERQVIAVRAAGAQRADFVVQTGDGEIRQNQPAKEKSPGVFAISSEHVVDTIRHCGEGWLKAQIVLRDGSSASITVCQLGAEVLAETASIDVNQLVLGGLAEIEEPAVWVWAKTAPWRPVESLPIVDGRVELPAELVEAGPLIIEVFPDDPFVTPAPPARPGAGAITACQAGWIRHDDPALDSLASYLAGFGALPVADSIIPQVWAALKVLPNETSDDRKTRSGLLSMLGRSPRAALEALGSASLDDSERVQMMIETALVDKPFDSDFTNNPLHLNPWIGSLVEISDLPLLRARAEEVADERSETVAYLLKQGGQPLLDLLRLGKMKDPMIGTFDRSAPQIDGWTPAQIDDYIEASRLVPGGILEPDSRVKVLLDDFGHRDTWARSRARKHLDIVPLYTKVKKSAPDVADLVVARNEALDGVDVVQYPWATLPMQSLTLAICARLTAHHLGYYLLTPETRESWVTMAEMFPGIVATDLLIAEAAVSHAKYGDLIGDVR